jgi:AAA+ superfamily predicted ATPase
MARSDLLISLVKSGGATPDPRFRGAVEALIAEERAKRHDVLADQLASALAAATNGRPVQSVVASPVVADLLYESNPDRGLADLILPPIVERECRGIIDEHLRADLLRSYGLAPRHRLLLVGPPGNGKTSVAASLAHDLMVPLLTIRYEGLIGSYLGETASRLRKVFDYARQRRCVLFFDEFDTVGKERGDAHETGEIKRVVSTLLLQMDQLPSHVVIVTATNHAELLDRAVWRRFEARLRLPPPSPKQIDQFVSRLFAGLKLSGAEKAVSLGKSLHGATYSEIEDLFRDLARRVVLEGPNPDLRRVIRDRLADWKQRETAETTRPAPTRTKPKQNTKPRRAK